MKVCITSKGNNLDSEVDPKFGRCANFIIVDLESMKYESIENKNVLSGGGAGIQSAQLVSEKNAEVLITGNVGPNAYETLNTAGIEIIIGVSGIVKDVLEKYKKREFLSADKPSVGSHSGMNGR